MKKIKKGDRDYTKIAKPIGNLLKCIKKRRVDCYANKRYDKRVLFIEENVIKGMQAEAF